MHRFSLRLQVSCVGQMVCAVVADTREHAKRGAYAVKISYEDLPDPIFTVEVRKPNLTSLNLSWVIRTDDDVDLCIIMEVDALFQMTSPIGQIILRTICEFM